MKIAVLGAGVVGTTCAYELMRDGHEVVLVEKENDAALGTSFGNAGFISPGHAYAWASPKAPGILLKSLWRNDQALRFKPSLDPALWRWMVKFLGQCNAERAAFNTARKVGLCVYSKARLNLIAEETGIGFDHLKKGCLYLFRSPAALEAGARKARILIDQGVEVETIDMDRAAALDPALEGARERFAGALFTPGDETGDCRTFVQRLAAHLAGRGADVRFGTTVQRIEAEGDRARRVVTDRGVIEADAVVLSLGVASPTFGRVAGVELPIYPVKGYSITAPVAGRNNPPTLGGIDEENLIAWARYGDRVRVTATAEFAGYATSWREADFRAPRRRGARGLPRRRRLGPGRALGGAEADDALGPADLRARAVEEPVAGHRPGPHGLDDGGGLGQDRRRPDRRQAARDRHRRHDGRRDAGRKPRTEGGMNIQSATGAAAGDAAEAEAVIGAAVAAAGAATRLIEHIPFETDPGIGARARMGLLVLASDHTIEHEFRAVLAHLPGVAMYAARLFNDAAITPATLAAMEGRIVPAAEMVLPDEPLDVVAFGCTSASMVLGEERVFELIRQAKPGTRATTPITAAFAALRAFGARRIGVLTPYGADVNAAMQRYVEAAGFEIAVFGSFNEPHDPTVAAITPDSVRRAARVVAEAAEIDALFVACTSLRLVEAAAGIEAELGLPVTSSNHATIWHCLRLAGVDDAVPGFGRLFGLPLA